jgi:hypothetical protein
MANPDIIYAGIIILAIIALSSLYVVFIILLNEINEYDIECEDKEPMTVLRTVKYFYLRLARKLF